MADIYLHHPLGGVAIVETDQNQDSHVQLLGAAYDETATAPAVGRSRGHVIAGMDGWGLLVSFLVVLVWTKLKGKL